MLPYRDSRPTRILLVIFALIILGYAYYEARGLLFGPMISISSQTASTVETPYVLIQGQTNHIASLKVDGEPISVTETGAFAEPYVLAPGVNRIVFDAVDKYGNATQKVIEIVYAPSATSSAGIGIIPQASSTQSSSSAAIAPTQ